MCEHLSSIYIDVLIFSLGGSLAICLLFVFMLCIFQKSLFLRHVHVYGLNAYDVTSSDVELDGLNTYRRRPGSEGEEK